MQNRREFTMLLEERAHWVAIGMLPVAALILGLLFVFQRRFYLFDHLIFTMHSLSFQGLLLSTVFLLDATGVKRDHLGRELRCMFASPVHLFVHMLRGTYKSSIFGFTLLRTMVLCCGSSRSWPSSPCSPALIWTSMAALESWRPRGVGYRHPAPAALWTGDVQVRPGRQSRREIARRVFRTAKRMGLRTVAVYSGGRRPGAACAPRRTRPVLIGPAPARESYLIAEKVLAAAKATRAGRPFHPGLRLPLRKTRTSRRPS